MRRTLFTAVGVLMILGACRNGGQVAGIGPITTGDDCIVETGAGKIMGYNDGRVSGKPRFTARRPARART